MLEIKWRRFGMKWFLILEGWYTLVLVAFEVPYWWGGGRGGFLARQSDEYAVPSAQMCPISSREKRA